jgi:hypothetical protein
VSESKRQEALKEILKDYAFKLLAETEKAMHSYATHCDVGDERTKAFDIYENIRIASRVN